MTQDVVQQDTQEEFQRFLERHQRNHQMRDAAVAGLAAIVQPRRLLAAQPEGSPLLVAHGAALWYARPWA